MPGGPFAEVLTQSTAALSLVALLALSGCGGAAGSGSPDGLGGTPNPGGTGDTGGTGGPSIAWGPRLDSSGLSAIIGATDDFGADIAGALARAARAVPNGASQSSLATDGRTDGEMSVRVVRDDGGNLVHEIGDGAGVVLRVPGPRPEGASLALFTDLIPGIEPDLSSYPHELLGIWALDGDIGAFWGKSPAVPRVVFGPRTPTGSATYEGDAVGLHAADGTAVRFLADVEIVADFDSNKVYGKVDKFRTLTGKAFDGLAVKLGATGFPSNGDPFSGETSAGIPGDGHWGARWSDGEGEMMGGTFGIAAADGSFSLLGAFSACHCAFTAGGNDDEPVATSQ